MNHFDEADAIMKDMYGHDVPMPLATVDGDRANIRVVDVYYKENAFFIATYGLSNKMKEIAKNPNVALSHNLFVAHGIGKNIGHPLEERNRDLREELKQVFFSFYDKHVDEGDSNTCFLKITLKDALVFANDYMYFVDFDQKSATRVDHVVDIDF